MATSNANGNGNRLGVALFGKEPSFREQVSAALVVWWPFRPGEIADRRRSAGLLERQGAGLHRGGSGATGPIDS